MNENSHEHEHENHQWTDDHAERFVQSMEKQLKTRYQPFAKRIAKIYRRYEHVEDPKIMDLACGPAYLLMEIQKEIPSASLLGVDSSEKMLNYARQKIKQYNVQGVEFKQGMAESLPIESNSYSVITCLNSFHDFKDPKKALNEVYRVLQKGGIFILKDKNPTYPKWKMKIHFFFLKFKMGKERSKRYYKSSHHWIKPQLMDSWMRDLNFAVNFISKSIDYIIVARK